MAAEIFTEAWASSWGKKINENEAYRRAAAHWEGAIMLVMAPDPAFGVEQKRAVVADLWHGECRAAKAARAEDENEAPYVILAKPATWKEVLEGRIDPLFGLLRGKLKLARGSIFSLVPYAAAAKELVVSAARVETSFPQGWR